MCNNFPKSSKNLEESSEIFAELWTIARKSAPDSFESGKATQIFEEPTCWNISVDTMNRPAECSQICEKTTQIIWNSYHNLGNVFLELINIWSHILNSSKNLSEVVYMFEDSSRIIYSFSKNLQDSSEIFTDCTNQTTIHGLLRWFHCIERMLAKWDWNCSNVLVCSAGCTDELPQASR